MERECTVCGLSNVAEISDRLSDLPSKLDHLALSDLGHFTFALTAKVTLCFYPKGYGIDCWVHPRVPLTLRWIELVAVLGWSQERVTTIVVRREQFRNRATCKKDEKFEVVRCECELCLSHVVVFCSRDAVLLCGKRMFPRPYVLRSETKTRQ